MQFFAKIVFYDFPKTLIYCNHHKIIVLMNLYYLCRQTNGKIKKLWKYQLL